MINRKNISLFCLLMLFMQSIVAQVQNNPPMRDVISSGGTTAVLPWGSIDYTIGEPIIWTYAPAVTPLTVKVLTQGFHQPNLANSSLDANVIFADASCIGGNNGSASINVFSSTGTVTYYWGPPLNDSSQNVSNLAPGSYPVHIDDGNFSIDDTIIIGETQIDCADDLDFYTGITPNGDNNNDFWTIGKIDLIKDNTVSIFNRWGDLVWKTTGYDNDPAGEKVWKGTTNNGGELPDATYFYVIEGNGRVYKGWVELTH